MSAHGHRTRSKLTLPNALRRLGLIGNCKLMLDPADAASYSSGQTWSDISGQGNDFYCGATSGSSTDDPTYVGTSGDLAGSTYWSFDSGDFFTLASGSNPTFLRDMHKAAAKGTVASWVWPASFASNQGIIGTSAANTANHGFEIRIPTNGQPNLVTRAGGTVPINKSTATALTAAAWNFVGMSFDEAGGAAASAWVINGKAEAFNGAATSPSSTNASYPVQIGASGNGATAMVATGRIGLVAVWDVPIGAASLCAFFDETRTRYGL